MPEFDPRRPQARVLPRITLTATCTIALAGAWQMSGAQTLQPSPLVVERAGAERALTPGEISALQHQAFAQAEAQPGLERPESVSMKIRRGETLEAAVRRLGVAPMEARMAVSTLGAAIDVASVRAGQAFDAAIATPRDRGGPVRLIGLSMRTGPAETLTLSRSFDGALKVREVNEETRDDTTVIAGTIEGSLYSSAKRAGAGREVTAQVVKLFSHKVDFSRDVKDGDPFRLVFDRTITESGRTIDTGDLLYAEVGGDDSKARLYRFKDKWFDADGKDVRGFMLRTPIDGARITSSFGVRRHPILGYTKMHQGTDFGAGSGTPILAAADGVVAEAQWNGGYGRYVRLRHGNGYDSAYAHMSGWAVKPGQRVAQGQVIGYVGSTGRSTGPHLHYEILRNGVQINPNGRDLPRGVILAGADLRAFKAQKAKVDALLTGGALPAPATALAAGGEKMRLRGAA